MYRLLSSSLNQTRSEQWLRISCLLLCVSLFIFFSQAPKAEAKTVSWSTSTVPELWYEWPDLSGWGKALGANSNVTVNYSADVYNADTGALIADNASVMQGTRLRFQPKAHADTDISWNGTGFSSDSPNGHWIALAAAPARRCIAQDFVARVVSTGFFRFDTDVYIPLSVAPPTNSFSPAGTAVLTNEGGGVYRVDSGGTISATFTFAATTGKYYYRYSDQWNTCEGNSTAMRLRNRTTLYTLNVPAQTINYTLTAISTNNAPAAPTITGTTTGETDANYTFDFNATDSDGDTIRYGIDWNNDSIVDAWAPGSGYVASGVSGSVAQFWTTVGAHTFQVRTQDDNNTDSGWTSHTITLTPPPPATADLLINSQNGPLSVAKDATLDITWSSTNAASCTLYGSGLPGGSVSTSGNTSVLATSSDSYVLTCDSAADSVDVTVVNQAPNTPTITGPSSIDAGENAVFAIITTDPDGDDIYYEVDWDSDGTADAFSASVPSNTSIPANNSWSVVGTTEFQARAIDTAGAQSAWAEHTITVNPAATSSTGVPVLEIYSDRTSVRNGEREVINWNTGTTTDLDCIVYGPNFEPIRFNSITDGAVGNRESEPITAKSEFVLSCTDPGGEVYTESLIIEALGSLMEI